jgi:hypothetical protein
MAARARVRVRRCARVAPALLPFGGVLWRRSAEGAHGSAALFTAPPLRGRARRAAVWRGGGSGAWRAPHNATTAPAAAAPPAAAPHRTTRSHCACAHGGTARRHTGHAAAQSSLRRLCAHAAAAAAAAAQLPRAAEPAATMGCGAGACARWRVRTSVFASLFAPRSSSSVTTDAWPQRAAQCSGVLPNCAHNTRHRARRSTAAGEGNFKRGKVRGRGAVAAAAAVAVAAAEARKCVRAVHACAAAHATDSRRTSARADGRRRVQHSVRRGGAQRRRGTASASVAADEKAPHSPSPFPPPTRRLRPRRSATRSHSTCARGARPRRRRRACRDTSRAPRAKDGTLTHARTPLPPPP